MATEDPEKHIDINEAIERALDNAGGVVPVFAVFLRSGEKVIILQQ